MRQDSVVRLVAVMAGVLLVATAAWSQQTAPATIPVVPTTPEKVSDAAAPTTVHGWHSSHLVRYGGVIYASVKLADPQDPDRRLGAIFRRQAAGDWAQVSSLAM